MKKDVEEVFGRDWEPINFSCEVPRYHHLKNFIDNFSTKSQALPNPWKNFNSKNVFQKIENGFLHIKIHFSCNPILLICRFASHCHKTRKSGNISPVRRSGLYNLVKIKMAWRFHRELIFIMCFEKRLEAIETPFRLSRAII